jgi:hypothetical protein
MVEKVVEVNGAARDEYFCVATFLPLRRWFDVIPFLLLTRRIERQLKRADGLLRYGLRTDFAKKSFWTISVWLNEGCMRGFVVGNLTRRLCVDSALGLRPVRRLWNTAARRGRWTGVRLKHS